MSSMFSLSDNIYIKKYSNYCMDNATLRHSINVMHYAMLIGEAIQYCNMEMLRVGAILHDIGKVVIPKKILNKPGKLDSLEYEIIKTHPVEGLNLVTINNAIVDQGILYHHEKVNGKGYPFGLKGDDIPLVAQIISIADVYEALVSDRPYRKAMSHERALDIIAENAGIMFNSDLVNVFLEQVNFQYVQTLK